MAEELPTAGEALAELRGDYVWYSLDHADPDEPLLRVRVPIASCARLLLTGRWRELPGLLPKDAAFAAIGPPWLTLWRRVRPER